jgi:hypothetical protein
VNTQGIIDAAVSHAMTLGQFDQVNMEDPVAPPGTELTCFFWVQSLRAFPGGSGLNSTTVRLVLGARIWLALDGTLPRDMIDPRILAAVDALCAAYSADFTLGGLVRNIDLQGESGEGLGGESGFVTMDDDTEFRVFTLDIPMVINDAWTQVA